MHLLSEKWLAAKAQLAEQQRKLQSADDIIAAHGLREKELSLKYGEEVRHSTGLSAHITRLQELIEEADSMHAKADREQKERQSEMMRIRQEALQQKEDLLAKMATEHNGQGAIGSDALKAYAAMDEKTEEAEHQMQQHAKFGQDSIRKSMKMMYGIVKSGLKAKREKELKAAEAREAESRKLAEKIAKGKEEGEKEHASGERSSMAVRVTMGGELNVMDLIDEMACTQEEKGDGEAEVR
jgi:hypothetical protein